MATNLKDIEYSAAFGALTPSAAEQAEFGHSHVLREIARGGHRVAGKGNYLSHMFWDKSGAGLEVVSARQFFAKQQWSQVLPPIHAQRKPNLRTAVVKLQARITEDAVVWFQVCTDSQGPRPDAPTSAPNMLECLGTGDWEWYTLEGIPLGPRNSETITLWCIGGESVEVFDTGTFGTPASGTATLVAESGFRDAGAAWNSTNFSLYAGAVSVRFLTSSGGVLLAARPVEGSTTEDLHFVQSHWLSPDEVRAANTSGVTYELLQTPSCRLGAFVMREEDAY